MTQIKIQRQNRKSLLMKTISGGVIVYIPRWMKPNSRQVKDFIQEGLTKLEPHIPPERTEITPQKQLRKLVNTWAKRMNLHPKKVSFRPMNRKWGSCSSIGNITLNTALATIPFELAEYVIVHELAHLKVFDHSPAFWELVAQYLPDYEVHRRALDRYPV